MVYLCILNLSVTSSGYFEIITPHISVLVHMAKGIRFTKVHEYNNFLKYKNYHRVYKISLKIRGEFSIPFILLRNNDLFYLHLFRRDQT